MSKILNVAMLSRWHVHAGGYVDMLRGTGKVNIKAVWDGEPELGKKWADSLGAEFEEDLDKLLMREDIDAVVCDAPTTEHKDVLIKAANAGKHIFTEKALAPTVAECEEIAAAVRKSDKIFTISLNHKCFPVNKFVKKCVENGDFGKITYARIRNAHDGVSGGWLPETWFDATKAAGGAMMDLGCHPMYLLDWFLGEPKKYTAVYNSILGKPVDENAVAVIEFKNGAIGVSETSFISYSSPYIVEIHGTEGVFVAVGNDIKFKCKSTEKYQNSYITPTLPKESPHPLFQFVDACINEKPSPQGFTIDDAIALTKLLEETYKVNVSK